MLNLTTVLVLNKKQKEIIDSFGVLTETHWKCNVTRLRKAIRAQLMSLQNDVCVYCGCPPDGPSDVEHIAHKAQYPQFLFTPKNLAYSCKTCNQTIKGATDVVIKLNADYDQCQFSIVHPYLDDVDHYLDTTKIQIKKQPNLPPSEDIKATNTLCILQLDQPITTIRRAKCHAIRQYCIDNNTSVSQIALDDTLVYRPGFQ